MRFSRKTPAERHGEVIKTLIDSFRYPRKGPGHDVGGVRREDRGVGGQIADGQQSDAVRLRRQDVRLDGDTTGQGGRSNDRGATCHFVGADARTVEDSTPRVCERRQEAAEALKYRDFLTVVLILKDRIVFDDNWIYIHDPSVKVGRVQNFKSWSPEMVPDPDIAATGWNISASRATDFGTHDRCGADRARRRGSW